MERQVAQFLCRLTSDFYANNSDSFSRTRQLAWPGWRTCVDILRKGGLFGTSAPHLSVLDLACGNMRFEAFLSDALADPPDTPPLRFFAVDNCDALASARAEGLACANGRGEVRYRSLDIMDALFASERLADALDVPPCDLSVSFGFMHHVPLLEQRAEVLDALVEATRQGGFVIVSFWRFLQDEKYAAKACAEHERAAASLGLPPLDEGDCVLGWNGASGAFRYCHSFSEGEIDELAAHVAPFADEIARFNADGRTGEMNTYLVLQRKRLRNFSCSDRSCSQDQGGTSGYTSDSAKDRTAKDRTAKDRTAKDRTAKGSGFIEMDETFYQRVYEQVRLVPSGFVCTYGTIAELAGGTPRASREVGLAMSSRAASMESPVPSYRQCQRHACASIRIRRQGQSTQDARGRRHHVSGRWYHQHEALPVASSSRSRQLTLGF